MKIYDISQELFSCEVYEGDPAPERKIICSIDNGDLYNLTAFSMCAHNGTHIDAPLHFIKNGKTVSEMTIEKYVGECFVFEFNGSLLDSDAEEIIGKTKLKKILIKGKAEISKEAAEVFVNSGIELLGVESQSVGPEKAPMEVHKILLSKEVVLLEGIRLGEVSEGEYFLSAAPLNMSKSDGAPCRAFLVDFAQS